MDLNLAKCLVEGGERVFAAYKDGRLLYCSNEKGVKPALEFLALGKEVTRGSSVADRVIGKGSSMIISLSGCENLHGNIMSKGALDFLKTKEMKLSWEKEVENIINRKGDDICPVEKLLREVEEPMEGLTLIKDFLRDLRR